MHLPLLADEELAALGSQTRRCGPSFAGADIDPEDDVFADRDGVRWIWADGEPAPTAHPLGQAGFKEIVRSQREVLPQIVTPSCLDQANRELVVVADVPSPGLLDTAFRLRGYYELLEDMTEQWPIANALFDQSADAIARDYEVMLRALHGEPDLVVYGDDLAFQSDSYISEERFSFFLRPRMSRIFSVIRSVTSADILFHSCGAALPILRKVVEMGVRVVNFEATASGMDLATVRRALGPNVVFHGVLDFVALATAMREGDRSGILQAANSIVAGWPMIAAPSDNLPASLGSADIRRVTAFLERLDIPTLLHGDQRHAVEMAMDGFATA
ncbi:uroporphyrinogen decarboxylase family protein [Methylorubrum extorquens]|nr:uroporphyrinogen decarboxylase family protein [Methylorubrum extorquens]